MKALVTAGLLLITLSAAGTLVYLLLEAADNLKGMTT